MSNLQFKKTLMARIHFVDFGNTEWVPVSGIKPLLNMFFDLPAQAIRCSLAHVEPEDPSKVPNFNLGKEKLKFILKSIHFIVNSNRVYLIYI